MIYDISNIRANGNFDVEVVSETGKGIKFSDISEDDFIFFLQNYDKANVILCFATFWRFITNGYTVRQYFNFLYSLN